ncbi:MAG: hypothetical protein II068_05620 [Bacteroidales bacterium]|nr:hypothetical protein [Bacteroidales bacterium]MBQ1680567.1 hypothetical protein [Bacteroidales bacterium]MBQ1754658.1 hypothetical protein [Bacteroidales bacterium]MBQ2195299.1 hypothetical protein [Bacteroidales bacterium]
MKGWKYFFGLVLAVGLFVSCEKEITVTTYLFYFNEEDFTQPRGIADPEVRAFYLDIREGFAKLNTYDLWQIDVLDRNFGPEDEKAVSRFQNTLAAIKEYEAKYRKEIGQLGVHEGSSFHIKYVYRLSRDVPADHHSTGYSPAILQEYSFELRYD